MIVANSQLVSEFQYYFNRFVKTSIVNKYEIPLPVDVDSQFLSTGTVIELLCSDEFPYADYTYLYKNEDDPLCWPTLTRQRLMIYPGSQYMIPATAAEGGINLFNLQDDDLLMLDVLLAYRHDSTSLILVDATSVVDSTAVEIVTDATSGITLVYASLTALSTALSKEIFLYLQFQLYGNYYLYDSSDIISDCTLLATCFELKLVDMYFSYMTDRAVSFEIDCDT